MNWLAGLTVGVLGALALSAQAPRKRLAAAALTTVLGAVVLAVGGLLLDRGLLAAGGFKILRGLGLFMIAGGAVNAGGILLFDVVLRSLRVNVAGLLRDLLIAAAYLVAGFFVLGSLGVNPTSLVATSAVVTAVVAFSLQETLGNLFGGMVMHLENTLAPGDYVKIPSGEEGRVLQIRWRQTTLETGSGAVLIVPNSSLMKGNVLVLARRHGHPHKTRRVITFHVYYDRRPNEVIQAVESALREDPPAHVCGSPKPDCLLADFKEHYAVYHARYWLDDINADSKTDSEVRARIYYSLGRAGMKISAPSRAVVVMQKDEEVQQQTRTNDAARRLAALSRLEIFGSLKDDERSLLAERLKRAPFARGEVLTRQGAEAHWLYIIVNGEADVRLEDGEAGRSVARLGPGDFMGEMGLLTGEARSATVTAMTDVECYRLDRESFADIVARRPQIVENISAVLARRRVELEAARAGLQEDARRQLLAKAQGDLLSRIRGLFRLG